ncbi:ferric reductase-like transmembrane domain-containing protein [Methyloligella sp. 2.7D]|uniref:ferredoxin reductase family protein n=1 Tax=unclassified Methyloligella TaxID=2625955 RepID=UPI00157C5226|nr:ferric reductase-like transmembrane domain-containing protein [Methyloligella sp. GL2]QKP78245.1 ferric reductase-like transmembrane domain-containing protein [Methyloligella sp. GL2]
MLNIKRTFWGAFALLTILWFLAEPSVFQADNFRAVRSAVMQYSGVIAIGAMCLAMVLALRPHWPERWFGGLDKMYRLHKWFGIAVLAVAVVHWLWAKGPKWAAGWGWFTPGRHGVRSPPGNAVEATFRSLRHTAESSGEWAFYALVVLLVLALIRYFPYRLFHKTHWLIVPAYLVLVFHSVVLMDFSYWTAPIGWVMAVLLVAGAWASLVALFGRIGADRQVPGEIASLQYYPGVRALEIGIDVSQGWPGHKSGQFAFATSDAAEGAHPYTIASGWDDKTRQIALIAKELGDHTSRLRERLAVGQAMKIEGPYGCFTFDDDRPHQIWIGGGIGITPFIAQMKHLAALRAEAQGGQRPQTIHLFHCTPDADETAFAKLTADAKAANVVLHLMLDSRDGLLTGEQIRSTVRQWQEASIWFCGPAGFGHALQSDFAAHGFPVAQHFHRELFNLR